MTSSRLSVSPARPACSRCFRTDAEGRIALRRDWPALFSVLRHLPALALQSRHSYARLIHLGATPEIVWDESGRIGRSEDGSLQLHPDLWGTAWGHLEICACCDSPGFVEIQNARGGDILQFCPTIATTAADWAACLEQLVAPESDEALSSRLAGFPILPPGLHPLHETAGVLPALLAAMGREEVPMRFLLRTPEVAHLREFVPARISEEYPLMTATDGRTTVQLGLPAVQGLAVGPDLSLHLAGPGQTLLLSLAPGKAHGALWRAALGVSFPSLHPFLSSR